MGDVAHYGEPWFRSAARFVYNNYPQIRRAANDVIRNPGVRDQARQLRESVNRATAYARQAAARYRQQQANRGPPPHPSDMVENGSFASTSAGRFGPARRVHGNATSRYASRGFCREYTNGGVVTDDNCAYLGHGDLPIDETQYNVCVAVIRSLFRNAQFDLESLSDVIPPLTDGITRIGLEWIDRTNTVVSAQDVSPGTLDWTEGTDTLGAVALKLYNFMRSAIVAESGRDYRRIYLASTGGNTRIYGTYNLASCRISILNTSQLKIQNSTINKHGGAGDVEDEDRESVNSIPLKGMAYFGKRTWTGVKPYQLLSAGVTSATGKATVPREIAVHPITGFMTLRGNASSGGTAAAGPYLSPPPPTHMMNVEGQQYITLEPGCMKMDALVFKWQGSFNSFWNSIAINGYYSTDAPDTNGIYSRSNLGHWKLFAFEKKLHSTTDKVTLRYENNTIIRTQCYLPKVATAMVFNDTRAIINFAN